MRIAHVNTHTYGGAAIVAARVHRALLKLKCDSTIVTKYGVKSARLPHHHFFKDARIRYFLKKELSTPMLYPIAKAIQRLRPHPNLANKPAGYEVFSPLFHGPVPDAYKIFENQDIIHLHWVNNFIDYESFFERFGHKKFVWTLHDMNPITGGCHHADGCVKFQNDCNICPQLKGTIDESYSRAVLLTKKKALEKLASDQMIIVSPSQWLSDLSKTSSITARFKNIVVPNPSFDENPAVVSREEVKRKLGLPLDKKIILFAGDNLKNPRKGIQVLFAAVSRMMSRQRCMLLGIGHVAAKPPGIDVHFTGSITDASKLAQYYYAADVFATPSFAENSPLVVIEALTCGTPVVASAVGGLTNLINEDNGKLFPVRDVEQLTLALEDLLFHRNIDRAGIQQRSIAEHHPDIVAAKYKTIYEGLCR